MIALLTSIMVKSFISTLLQYYHWRNTFSQQLWPVNYSRNSLIGTVFPPILLCNEKYSIFVSSVFCDFSLDTFKFYVWVIVVYSTFVSHAFFILSCTMLHFGFVCSQFGLFFYSDTNNSPLQYRQTASHCPPSSWIVGRRSRMFNGGA